MSHLLVQSDARRLPLADGSVHCAVTSPPYFALRDYGTATWEGGDEACDHVCQRKQPTAQSSSRLGYPANGDPRRIGDSNTYHEAYTEQYRDICGKCGARRVDRQIGLEATPEEFVAKLVAVFREVKRVLRDDGTCWVNLGDSYASGEVGRHDQKAGQWMTNSASVKGNGEKRQYHRPTGLKPKDLVGIPWRVAFALQADGWYLRSDIVWSKPNAMPERATDRPTKAHEYVFLLSKNERYFWDAEAVREAHVEPWRSTGRLESRGTKDIDAKVNNGFGLAGIKPREYNPAGRNIRSVWTIPTEAYPGAHYATFPRKLVMPCIKAGTSQRGVCPICSAPWERVTETSYTDAHRGMVGNQHKTLTDEHVMHNGREHDKRLNKNVSTLGWRPTCSHDAEPVPATVLDPFNGSGTTGVVALALKRNYIGCDLSADYLKQAERRISRPHARVERASKPEPMPLFAGLDP